MAEEQPQGKTNITWSANEIYLTDFSAYFQTAQKLFLMARQNNKFILDLFFHVHEVYRMEAPYFDGDVNFSGDAKNPASQAYIMKKAHDWVQQNVEQYSRSRDTSRRDNFDRIYRMLDILFSELTKIAVDKNFFPKAQKARNLNDLQKAMEQR